MSAERFEVTFGADVGTHVFETLQESVEWVTAEREFWRFLQAHGVAWHTDNDLHRFFTEFEALLNGLQQSVTNARNAQLTAERNKQEFNLKNHYASVSSIFRTAYVEKHLIHSKSPKAAFLKEMATKEPIKACYAAGFFMQFPVASYDKPVKLQGAMEASFFDHGFINPIQSEQSALTTLRTGWEAVFQKLRVDLDAEIEKQKQLNIDADQVLVGHKETFGGFVRAAEKEWTNLQRTYDHTLALAKPVQYWTDKAKKHLWLSWAFGITSLGVGIGVFVLILKLIQITLRGPAIVGPLVATPNWQPEYWRIAVLVAAGVFSVWVVRIFVQLFLSNVHLLTDANERVTMAKTYLALMRREAALKPEDRQLILQTLFRPTVTGVVKDDGVPLAILDWITKSGGRPGS